MKGEKGFTLIELLVVVAIIGILVAIAIPQFANYKKQANDSAAESDVRNMALSEESYYATNNAYTDTLASLNGVGFKSTKNVTTVPTLTTNGFVITAFHPQGTKTFTWDSTAGGMQ
ncbi:MAG: prepilin-type N-terminal cleavage/methylation domain-containing protein [Nitrospinae bacterium]|nr:prepilin-type N-terminal cleavage/methylation domain-containing protein [Nitrospinota bacterium]